jgi:hypothetical protein
MSPTPPRNNHRFATITAVLEFSQLLLLCKNFVASLVSDFVRNKKIVQTW